MLERAGWAPSGDEKLEREGQAQHDVSRAKESVEDAGRKIKDVAKDATSSNERDADDR